MGERAFVGVDVGTASVRAGVVDRNGRMLGVGVEAITVSRPSEDFVEQSSEEIWRACGLAIRKALQEAGVEPGAIAGLGFDATCSLVVVDAQGRPLSVNSDEAAERNVVVWMDHRATEQASRINATKHEVLRYVGGGVSPEMQTPKLLWIKENLPETWGRAARFYDLPDYLVVRATGVDVRSECTTTCKWTYLAHENRWDEGFFQQVGLGDLAADGFEKIGSKVAPVGSRAGELTELSARELGLVAGTAVAVALIDAHAGGVGVLGFPNERLALIGGTSTCHMVVSKEPRFVPGVWGPYFSAMVPGLWLSEGGQSATGALIDHTIQTHCRGRECMERAKNEGISVYSLLNGLLETMSGAYPFPAALTHELHVLPDHHGNRSPWADASLRGMVSGLRLTDSLESLALLYLATIQALAHGTKHILDVMNAHGHRITTLVATGGDSKNPLFLREHADVTGMRIVLPREREAVLLGSAMLGAVASSHFPSLLEAMRKMGGVEREIVPAGGALARYHEAKHRVFLRMYEDQRAYREAMAQAAFALGSTG